MESMEFVPRARLLEEFNRIVSLPLGWMIEFNGAWGALGPFDIEPDLIQVAHFKKEVPARLFSFNYTLMLSFEFRVSY